LFDMEKNKERHLASLPDGFCAVVIGASGGIGRAIADLLARQHNIGNLVTLSRASDGFDLLDERSVSAAAGSLSGQPVHCLICATGILTTDGHPPEKSLRQVDPDLMLMQFRTNAIGPALVAKHFLPLLDRRERSIAAFLSARVGSIGDNRLGGWISYRASTAALNQIVHTASIEAARTHPKAAVVALHPGTVRTNLSDPYSGGHRTVDASGAAISMITTLNAVPEAGSGSFLAYDGSAIPW
jgi:NAD(P)-dependent dehydrogenase (short-subunit alcohol dehydrogenase family)